MRRWHLIIDLLAGKTVFDTVCCRESELSRLASLFAQVDLERWREWRILEVGAGLGYLGDAFSHLGFDVTSTDGRRENVERIRARGREAFVLDLDGPERDALGDFEVILAFGVLYHLSEPERFLRKCAREAKVLLLESCVTDASEPCLPHVKESRGWAGRDQALHGHGCRPSPVWVENVCRDAGFDVVRDVSNPLGNWVNGRFDWQPLGNNVWRRGGANLRKMWVIEKAS